MTSGSCGLMSTPTYVNMIAVYCDDTILETMLVHSDKLVHEYRNITGCYSHVYSPGNDTIHLLSPLFTTVIHSCLPCSLQ